jgi:hypothetical protein
MGQNILFFFFSHVHTRGGRGIRTSDLRFIRRDPNRLNYLLGTKHTFEKSLKVIFFFFFFLKVIFDFKAILLNAMEHNPLQFK